ncbi:pyridoxamine 5'-phosphate oxidase family protein [Pseudodesulfovibrio indicus]|uniref:pyridoxamine 5'-phosphate oxidase family protein n=1 Tax=Pseudodesulfovibrio indicus TaxID=1716143 RepID=UPI00292D4E5B|nr:pyridoxamine 5'-phosphate oxidase family protein [Pseudodesulfovibrio indicus]
MRKGVTDEKSVVDEVLAKAEVLWLALNDQDGPYSVPVNFAHDGEVIYVHSGMKGRKAACLDSGAPLAFSCAVDVTLRDSDDNGCELGYLFRSVQGRGVPRPLSGDEKMRGLDAITLKYAGREMPYKDKVLAITNVYAIDAADMTARIKE